MSALGVYRARRTRSQPALFRSVTLPGSISISAESSSGISTRGFSQDSDAMLGIENLRSHKPTFGSSNFVFEDWPHQRLDVYSHLACGKLNMCRVRGTFLEFDSDDGERHFDTHGIGEQPRAPRPSFDMTIAKDEEAAVAAMFGAFFAPFNISVPADVDQSRNARCRPPKPLRIVCKDFAYVAFKWKDRPGHELRLATQNFIEETNGEPVLLRYTLSVLRSLLKEERS